MKNTIQVDDKQALQSALQLALTEGEKFAKEMFDYLIRDWGADKHQIDQIGLIEMGTGHFMQCCMSEETMGDPAEYIADCLARYSDVGLAKMGLKRERYEARAEEFRLIANGPKQLRMKI